MYSKSQLALKYLNYYFTASNGKGHGVHSPFVFEFITKILNDKAHYPEYDVVEELRQRLLKDKTIIAIEDFGAGSSIDKTDQRTIASIAKNAAKSKKYGQLLFRMVKYYQPETVLELGTSVGITTSYLASANSISNVISLEGAKAVAEIARDNFKKLGLNNIHLTEGNFDSTLSIILSQLSSIDFCFIDGNHKKEPTEKYFRQLLDKVHNNSILIFDDIHWSREMEEAWNYCKEHELVTLSIDLFFWGILFFRKEIKEKQHFRIRF